MIGEKIREARVAQKLSLSDVARKAKISVATLSRIETNKQNLDVPLFLQLSRILKATPEALLNGESEAVGPAMAEQIASMPASQRVRFWHELSDVSRAARASAAPRRRSQFDVSVQIEELLAQIEFIRGEVETVRKNLKSSRKR